MMPLVTIMFEICIRNIKGLADTVAKTTGYPDSGTYFTSACRFVKLRIKNVRLKKYFYSYSMNSSMKGDSYFFL